MTRFVEVIVDRPIIKRSRQDFADFPEEEDVPLPELASHEGLTAENPLGLTFHYHLPPSLEGKIQVGHLVAAPFRSQQLMAVVIGLSDTAPVEDTRPVAALLDPEPVLTPAQISLAQWFSREYIAPLATCLRHFLPPGSGRKQKLVIKAIEANIPSGFTAQEQALLAYLRQNGATPLSQVHSATARSLIEKGLAATEAVLAQPGVGPKVERMVELLISPDEIDAVLLTLGRPSKQAELLVYLADLDDPLPDLAGVLQQVGCSLAPVKALVEKEWVKLIPAETLLDLAPRLRARKQSWDSVPNSPSVQKILSYLMSQGRPVPMAEVITATATDQQTIETLLAQKLVARFDEPERITLTLPLASLPQAVLELRQARKPASVLQLLAAEEGPVWVGWVYAQTQANLKTLKDLAEAGLIRFGEGRRWRDPLAGRTFTLEQPPQLSEAQQQVWETVLQSWQLPPAERRPLLLHGVTGSGKTEIYLQAIATALAAGYGAIMMVPEITLATQTVERVSVRFPGRVAIWHSALSPGERYDTWERVRAGELPVVVGPRSALFAPISKLGVIIVDEEHEPAYKNRDWPPLFHAREAALELGRLAGAMVIMGSATPDVVSYRKAERGEFQLLSLPNRILAHTKHLAVQKALLKRNKSVPTSPAGADFVALPMPKVEVVDLREELKAGNRSIFSRLLQDAIQETLKREEQVILFLNRRGAASFVICRDCGYVMRCPRCDTTMTYHSSGELMVCHYCSYRIPTTNVCPNCNSDRIRFFGLGTQRVEESIQRMFPQAKTIRWDWDSTRQKGSHDLFLQHFMSGRANVLVGTQMVAKGLDLPLVTLVGVISADTALYLPDFRAAERTFQLLMQVAGRAGRSPLGGRVIVQTYTPDQVPIEAAANHDYEGFYQTELAFRQEQRYPPFKRVALLLYTGPGSERSSQLAKFLANRIRRHVERQGLPAVEVIGPTPSYVQRVRNQYRWHILLRAQDPAAVLRPLLPLPQGWRVDIDPVSLL